MEMVIFTKVNLVIIYPMGKGNILMLTMGRCVKECLRRGSLWMRRESMRNKKNKLKKLKQQKKRLKSGRTIQKKKVYYNTGEKGAPPHSLSHS